MQLNQALCEICENLTLKLKALDNPTVGKSISVFLNKSLCKSEFEFYAKRCIEASCHLCGPQLVKDRVSRDNLKEEVALKQWAMKEVKKEGKILKKKGLVCTSTSGKDILNMLCKDLQTFPLHHLKAKWQYSQYLTKKKNLRDGELVAALDFVENFRCQSQDEAQSAHWNYQQLLITDAALDHIIKTRDQHFHRFIQFTDGCAAQYKSKRPFFDIQRSVKMRTERHFFGSRHGKNPSDGEAAVIKSAAMRAIKCRQQIIQDAKDFYEFGVAVLTKESSCTDKQYGRKFLFVKTDTIQAQWEAQANFLPRPVPGTRSIQVVQTWDNGQSLLYQNLSCFCSGCEDGGDCRNADHADAWKYFQGNQVDPEEDLTLNLSLDTSIVEFLQREALSLRDTIPQSEPVLSTDDSGSTLASTADSGSTLVASTDDSGNTLVASTDDSGSTLVASTDDSGSTLASTSKGLKYATGTYVSVHKYGKKAQQLFNGIIQNNIDGEYEVRFMERKGNAYIWPERDDISVVPV
ncbi:(S)-beta-bisabolene synthase [Elysia marginata]|uniref:(S)-beta-bisabolene synthase n=1 Tax=Elysia marginata TaxID=1093978 RepID=A0AAV4IK76_9GAST|nr:(S)-beta-bisabolene synthase [Elysia marginata]